MPSPSRSLVFLPLLAAVSLACGSSTSESSGGGGTVGDVIIPANASQPGHAAFTPDTFTVSLAAEPRVVWSNRDKTGGAYGTSGVTHHLVSDDPLFDSGNLLGGKNFGFTFTAVDTIPYHCSIHPTMVGAILVNP